MQWIESFNKATLRSVNEQRFEFHGELLTSPSGKWLVMYPSKRPNGPGVYGSPELVRAEVLRAADQQVVGFLERLTSFDLPIFNEHETEVAFLNRIMPLAEPLDGKAVATTVPDRVVGFLGNDRLLLLVDSPRTFKTRIPFLRHWYPEGRFSQLCIFDRSTGKVIRRSREMLGGYLDVRLARNGKVAAVSDAYNTLQIWDIPQVD